MNIFGGNGIGPGFRSGSIGPDNGSGLGYLFDGPNGGNFPEHPPSINKHSISVNIVSSKIVYPV